MTNMHLELARSRMGLVIPAAPKVRFRPTTEGAWHSLAQPSTFLEPKLARASQSGSSPHWCTWRRQKSRCCSDHTSSGVRPDPWLQDPGLHPRLFWPSRLHVSLEECECDPGGRESPTRHFPWSRETLRLPGALACTQSPKLAPSRLQ